MNYSSVFSVDERSRWRSLGSVVVVLILVLAVGPGAMVVDAKGSNDGSGKVTVDRQCTGGWFETKMCQMMNSVIGWILTMVADFVQGIITWIVNAIVGTPVPKHNGQPAIFQPPTNQPWKGIYESWLTFALPLGLVEWALMVLGILFSNVYISDPATELKRRELKHRSWKVLFAVLGSWAIGATILHIANGITLTVAPDGELIAKNLGVFAGNMQAVGLAAILVWLFGGVLFLFILLLILAKYAVVFTLMWALPVLLPLAAFNVGPVAQLSKPARGLIDMFIPFAFLTLPMALVLRVCYVVVTSLNETATAQLGMTLLGGNALLILGFWIVAAVSPLFVFSQTGRIQGFAAGLAGASISSNIDNLGEKVQDAKDRVDWHVPPEHHKSGETHDPLDGRDTSSHGGFGGTLGGGFGGGANRQSMLDAGTQSDQSPGGGFAGPGPGSSGATGTGLAGARGSTSALSNGGQTTTTGRTAGTGSEATTGSDTISDRMISSEDVTRVRHPRDLPSDEKYQIGQVKDDGEFQPIRKRAKFSHSGILNGRYNRLNTGTEKYENEKLLLRSRDDGSFYDIDSMTYREQSYEQMSRDTSEDVLNS
jgi:hypothetical protein